LGLGALSFCRIYVTLAVFACVYFGICGELAKTDRGYGSYMVNLIDRISTLGKNDISKYMKVEVI
jgi:hydroxyethylthiazole kinase-like sugar kinase family protein